MDSHGACVLCVHSHGACVLCVYMLWCMCVRGHRETFESQFFSFHYVGLRDQTQLLRQSGNYLYLLSCLIGQLSSRQRES